MEQFLLQASNPSSSQELVNNDLNPPKWNEANEQPPEAMKTIPEEVKLSKVKSVERKKRLRKASDNSSALPTSAGRRLTKKKGAKKSSTDETTDEEEGEQEARAKPNTPAATVAPSDQARAVVEASHELVAKDKVYARWTDPAGVYFYAAEVVKVLNQSEAKVRFLEDKIERTLKIDSELINVTSLHPHDEVTVKHDILEVYDVTAKLMSFPVRNADGDVEYEVQIVATESEPQLNEDSRNVHYSEVSLTDNQASLIIRRMGFVPASNKVSADINFGNLIFGKRKPRTVNASPASAGASTTTPNKPKLDSPGVTPKKSGRRKRGGSNVEDSASTEQSAPETTPRSKKSLKTVLSFMEAVENPDAGGRARKQAKSAKPVDTNMFKAMST